MGDALSLTKPERLYGGKKAGDEDIKMCYSDLHCIYPGSYYEVPPTARGTNNEVLGSLAYC